MLVLSGILQMERNTLEHAGWLRLPPALILISQRDKRLIAWPLRGRLAAQQLDFLKFQYNVAAMPVAQWINRPLGDVRLELPLPPSAPVAIACWRPSWP